MSKNVIAYAKTGVYEGFEDDNGVVNFLGIHYAQKPERWKRAKPLPASNDRVVAKEFGAIPWQTYLPEELCVGLPRSEDCLTLNIWTDDVDVKGKPVMLWIHGGCYISGSNRVPHYCSDQFCADCRDIVFVNINYRLGAFASLDLSLFDPDGEYEFSGSLNTLDQMEAVKWVYENIEAFGGDPGNITVYGQSAGSFSTATLLLIPEVNQYISKAICQSSGYANNMKDVEYSKRIGAEFARLAGASCLEDLLNLSAEQVLEYSDMIFNNLDFPKPYESVRDGKLIPLNPYEALRNGVAKHVTLMSGTVSGEYDTASFALPDEAIMDRIQKLFGDRVTLEKLNQFIYQNDPDRSYRDALLDFRNDLAIRIPVLCTLEAQAASGATTYLYYMHYVPEGNTLRTQHLFEIPFFNNKLDIPMHMDMTFDQPVQGKNPDRSLIPQIQGCWANFARYGNPGGAHIGTDWEPYTLEKKNTMVMTQGQWEQVLDFKKADSEITQPMMNQ